MDDANQKPQQLNIELSEEVAQGVYSLIQVQSLWLILSE